jgi:hypothetical protein
MKNARADNPRTKCLGLYYEPFESRMATRSEILRASFALTIQRFSARLRESLSYEQTGVFPPAADGRSS